MGICPSPESLLFSLWQIQASYTWGWGRFLWGSVPCPIHLIFNASLWAEGKGNYYKCTLKSRDKYNKINMHGKSGVSHTCRQICGSVNGQLHATSLTPRTSQSTAVSLYDCHPVLAVLCSFRVCVFSCTFVPYNSFIEV